MITIIDNGGANLSSIIFSLNRLGVSASISNNAKTIKNSSHLILPGVSSAKSAMKRLEQYSLIDVIRSLTQPVLGICLGMQLFFEFSEEGNVECLKLLPGKVKRFVPSPRLSVPHMGWNEIGMIRESKIMVGIPHMSHAYFVHSYFAPIDENTTANTYHGELFAAAVEYKNFYGTQFHPEKSGENGSKILKNFLEL